MNNKNNDPNNKEDFNNNIEKTLFYDLDSIEPAPKKQVDNKQTSEIDKLVKKAEKSRYKKVSKQNKSFFLTVWIIMIVLLSAMLTKYILVGTKDMLASDRPENTVTITLPTHPNLLKVTKTLNDSGAINNPSFFNLYAFVTRSTRGFTGGTFEIKTNMDYEELINYLEVQSNRTDIIKLTFVEGMNVIEYADMLEKNEICKKQDFLNICSSSEFDEQYSFIKSIPNADERYYKLEGYLFPDTYQFYKDEEPYNVVDKMLSNFDQRLNTKEKASGYENKVTILSRIQDKGTSLEQMINIASIVQAEAANKDDMYMVASVIYNRLSTMDNGGINEYGEYGMWNLGEDSTVWYPYRDKASVPSDIAGSFQSTYNTYKIKGLPPGPICNPGKDAIDATLNPESTNYYYFCHSSDGKAYYAKTIDQHNKNLKLAGLV